MRDPRVDPRPGDVIQWTNITVRIERLAHGIVYYRCRAVDEVDFRPVVATYLEQYRRWAKDAEVVTSGKEAV